MVKIMTMMLLNNADEDVGFADDENNDNDFVDNVDDNDDVYFADDENTMQ
jgi:hypothetical protein